MKKALLVCLLVVSPLAALPTFAQTALTDDPLRLSGIGQSRHLRLSSTRCPSVKPRHKLDGELTDEVWSRAEDRRFVQRDPKEGASPTYATEARIAYDAQHLYVAILAHDPEPDKIASFLTRRDSTRHPTGWRC